jgi:hypothetical protein
MTKKQTPLQELIDWLNEREGTSTVSIISKAEQLLEKEKNIIMDAYAAGIKEMTDMADVHNKKSWFFELTFDQPTSPETYYQETFIQ